MHRIVILEDAPGRIDWFRDTYRKEDFAATDSVEEFLHFVNEAEKAGTLKLIIMDHDLGILDAHGDSVCGSNGADAAKKLTTTAPVLIWSINEYGARNIELTLRDKGIHSVRVAFYASNFKTIANIINQATAGQ